MNNWTVPLHYPELASDEVHVWRARLDRPDTFRQGSESVAQMPGDLFARGPVAVAQLSGDVLPRLGQERQDRLIALLSLVLRVVALARAHLASI